MIDLPDRLPSAVLDIEIPLENITTLRELGRGEFGVVMEASAVNLPLQRKNVTNVAIKLLKEKSDSAKTAFVQEAVRLQPLKHENVCALLAVHLRSEPMMIVLELMSNGDLKSFLQQAKGTESIGALHLLKIGLDVARGFSYMQDMRYVHRDIAARNVLLSSQYVAKIGDFGLYTRASHIFGS